MHFRSGIITLLVAAATLSACGSDNPGTIAPSPPSPPVVPPAPAVLLKDIEIPRLPSPYYHFEYDATGRISVASFASGLTKYDVTYDGGRISRLTNNTLGSNDRLEYTYDAAGRATSIHYVRPDGTVFTSLTLTYDGTKLIGIERNRQAPTGFVVDKTMAFSYYADGNVREITEHWPTVDGFQTDATTVDRFEQYDDKINVDAFSLLHDEFFDHLVLLPAVRLQMGNPGRVIHTGDGTNYEVVYTYAYDDNHRPLTKAGVLTFTNGSDAGKQFPTLSQFSYY